MYRSDFIFYPRDMTSFVLLNEMLWFLEFLFLCGVVVLISITSCVAGKPPDDFLVLRSQAHKVGNKSRQKNTPVVIAFWKNNCTQAAKVILFNMPNVGYYKVEDCRPFWIVSQKCEASWRQFTYDQCKSDRKPTATTELYRDKFNAPH